MYIAKKIKTKLLTLTLVVMCAMQIVAPFFVSAQSTSSTILKKPIDGTKEVVYVDTWSDIEKLGIETNGAYVVNKDCTIILKNDVVAASPIIFEGTVHITSNDNNNKTIYRDKGNTNFTVFTVNNNGYLTLGENVVMTGKVAQNYENVYTLIVTDGVGNALYKKHVYPNESNKSVKDLLAQSYIYFSKKNGNEVIFEEDAEGTQGPDWDRAKWSLSEDSDKLNTIFNTILSDKNNSPHVLDYTFNGWDFGDIDPEKQMSQINEDVTVVAKWNGHYRFRVTDGCGNTIYKDYLEQDETRSCLQIMTAARLIEENSRNQLLETTLSGKNGPFTDGYVFKSWNYGEVINTRPYNKLEEKPSSVTVIAEWEEPERDYVFKVTDANGNEIYKDTNADKTKTIIALMQNAGGYDLTTPEGRDAAFAAKLSEVDGPYKHKYIFEEWNYGKKGENNINSGDTLSSVGGNLTVVAKWRRPPETIEYTWVIPDLPENDKPIQIGLDGKFVSVNDMNVTTNATGINISNTWIIKDVQSDGRFRLYKEDRNRYLAVVQNGVSGMYNSTMIPSSSLNSSSYPNFFEFEKDNSTNPATYYLKVRGSFSGGVSAVYLNWNEHSPVWFTENKPNSSANPYVGVPSEIKEFDDSDVPGYSEADPKINPTSGCDIYQPTERPGKQTPLGIVEQAFTRTDNPGGTPNNTNNSEKLIDLSKLPEDARYSLEKTPNTERFDKTGFGFFVQVNNGTLDIDGAVLTELKTGEVDAFGVVKQGTTVTESAPVVVNGGSLSFNSGEIKNNEVGYIANDNCSGMQAQGRNNDSAKQGCNFNGVESYIKDTAMTNTAGGIIFTNGAKGEISGNATIRENRGDVGGILVQNPDTDVTIGGKVVYEVTDTIPSDKSYFILGTDNKYYVVDTDNPSLSDELPQGVRSKDNNMYDARVDSSDNGGHIDNNVGFHHAGAALVEDGAILRMASDSSTMNNNVTWAKGGAVWATEFGTAGYAKIEYNNKKLSDASKVIKDAREEGVFIMVDGTIDNNTAFLRGGGINVESNKVYLIGGTISNNNSRVLGGGIYVEGDFPDYTYTLIINRGYVGHNYAVRYKPLDNSKPSTGGSWDDLTLTELNDRLDRRIGTSNYESITNQRISDESNTLNPDPKTALNDENIASGDGYPNRTADTKAYPMPHEGYGGGVWLCPIGGTAVFHMNADHEVIIDDNYASGKNNSDKTRGTDLYLHSGSGHMLVANTVTNEQELEVWINEATGEQIPENGPTYSGPLYLRNETPDNLPYTYINNQDEKVTTTYGERKQAKVGIQIIDNISRDGGGIAANGTLLFGLPNDVYRGESELDFTKRWPADNDHINKVNFKMFYTLKYVKDGSSYYFVDGDGKVSSTATNPQPTDLIETDDTINNLPVYHRLVEMPEYEFDLDGTNNSETTYDYSPETGSSTNPQNGEILWKAKTTIPTSVLLSGKTSYPMYRLKYKGEDFTYYYTTSSTESSIKVEKDEVINPATVIGMKKLYAIAHEKPNDSDLEIVDWNIVIKEYDEAGNEVITAEFKSIAGRTVKVEKDESIPFTVIDAGGLGKEVTPGYNINFSTLSFESEVKNGDGPSVEKYINNKVHQDLTTFEDVFEYEIMAYVPLDAEEIILYDTLQEPLMFVDSGYGGDYNAHPQYLDNGNVNPKFNGTSVQHQRWAMTGNNKENSGRHQIVVIDKNNHIGDGETGLVLSQGTDIVFKNGGPNPVSIGTLNTTTDVFTPGTLTENTGNTIYYVLNNETIENFESLRGKWVKVSFDAAIRPGYKDTEILKQKGWISDSENKKGSVNFISKLEETENVTVTKMFKNEVKGLYYALGEKENGDKKYYIYVSYSPDKIRNVENNVQPRAHEHGTEKDEFLAYEWYEVYQGGYSKYRLVSDTLNYNNVNLWHAYYKVDKDSDGNITRGYEYEQDVTYDNVKNLLANNANATINGHNATYLNVYNYPVLNAANPHSGEKNQADYIVKYPHGAQSRYKTNIVTVDINLPEKYVNNKTHDILAAFDDTFEYEIMVYVPNDAKEIMIWDTLKDDLMFVDRFDNTQYKTYNVGTTSNPNGTDVLNENFNKKNGYNESPMIANSATYGGYRLTYFKTNNHTGDGTGTVKNTGEPLNEPITKNQSDDNLNNDYIIVGDLITDTNGNVTGITPNNSGKSILIKIDESTNIQAVRGKWVKASFTAEIKPSRYDDIAKKISKDNMLTDDPALKDPNYPNPVGYYYRLEATTLYSENKIAGTSAKANVHYLKDASGKFTDRQTTAHPTTRQDGSPTIEGVDYRLEYEADFLYFSKTKPEGIADTNLKPMYVRNGWNAADPTISWEFITDDGKVIDGEKLYDKTPDEDKPIGVQQNGDHAGLANKANYAVKIDNEFKYTTTNTVTVVPKERDLEITKIWQVKGDTVLPSVQDFINNLELWWEYDDTNSGQHNKVTGNITDLYKNNIRIVFDKTEVTGESVRHEWKIIIDDLPKLSAEGNMHYFIKEKQPFTGYNLPEYSQEGHAHHNGRIKNGLIDNEGTTHLSVSKNWDDGISNENHSETITVRLLGNGETIYQRNSENKIVDADGNPITTSGNDPAEWEYSERELNNTNSFEYEWDDLPRYQFDQDGNSIYIRIQYTLDEYHQALNGEKFINNGTRWVQNDSGNVLTKEQIEQIFLTTDTLEATGKNESTDEIRNTPTLADIAYSIELLSDPEGYVLSEKAIVNKRYTTKPESFVYPEQGNSAEIIKAYLRIDLTVSPAEFYDNSNKIEANAQELEYINNNLAACKIDDVTELPETGPYETSKVYECYRSVVEEYDTYEVDLINTKPQIEKYINKDVHHETYIGNDFEYDIIAYVPEEATEIEIFDELLPTLKLKALMEPNIVNDTIHGYNERSVASLPAKMNVAVLSSNNHIVNGTVSNNKVDGTAEATIIVPTDNSNSFKLKIDNIYSIARSGDYIEYEHGEYFKVAPIEGGETVYCKADEIRDDYRPINYTRYRIANEGYYELKDDLTPYVDDDIIEVSKNNIFYKFMRNADYVSAYGPTYKDENDNVYTIKGKYEQQPSSDQAIGGKFVRVTFKAEFDLEKSEQLKAWINDIRSNFTDNKNLNWDVIKTESNQGWDGYIASLDYQKGRDEYVLASNVADGPVTELAYLLGKNKINKVIKNDDKYYGALDNEGNYYVYPMNLTSDSQYNNQWFRVVGNPIRYYTLQDSDNPVKNGSTFDGNSDYWFAGNNSYIKPTIDNGTNLIKNDTILVPVVENETYYKEVITGEPDKYYLDWVVEEYAGTKADSIIAKGEYKKIDWGRGDGDIIRSNSENPSPYTRDHAGVVNTASYEVTYGNRYKSTHKSNTVTVVPQIYELPSSGGMGTFLFNILGVAFITMALCEIVLEIQKRKKSI